MGLECDRLIGRSENSYVWARVFRSKRSDQIDRRLQLARCPVRRGELEGLVGVIVAVLDRDSLLRHEYLLRRWQGNVDERLCERS